MDLKKLYIYITTFSSVMFFFYGLMVISLKLVEIYYYVTIEETM